MKPLFIMAVCVFALSARSYGAPVSNVAACLTYYCATNGITEFVANGKTQAVERGWSLVSDDNKMTRISDWFHGIPAPDLAAFTSAYEAQATAHVRALKESLSGDRSMLTAQEKALGLTMITIFNGRLSNLVLVLNQKMGLTGTNRITAASIGGVITPAEASGILQKHLQ